MKRVKTLTIKSRTAILLFLSALTLTLVFYISLPARTFTGHNNYQIETQIEKRRTAKLVAKSPQVASAQKIFNNHRISLAYAPWTAATSPRGPPV